MRAVRGQLYASTNCTLWLFRLLSSTSVGVRGFLSISFSELGLGVSDLCVKLLTICGLSNSADLGLVVLETDTERAMPMVPTVGD